MIKLTKKVDAYWKGNGMGNATAEWVVKGTEHLHVWEGGLGWNITDRSNEKRIVKNVMTKKMALEWLEIKHPELAS